MNQLICIIGPDGTGKTTQANLLIDSFKKKGTDYEYKWLRFYHFFSLPLLGFARLIGLSEVKTLENGEKIGYHYFYKSKLVSKIYYLFLFLDTYFLIFFKIYLPTKLFNNKLICDRFIYDTIVDLMISTGNYNAYKSNIGKLFLKLIPKNTNTVLLITDEKTLRNRRDDLFHDENLKLKIKLYKQLSEIYNIPVIDAGLPIKEIQKDLIKKIK